MAVEQQTGNRAVTRPADRSGVGALQRFTAASLARRVVYLALLIGFTILFVYPFIWLVSASLKPGAEVFSGELIGSRFVPENYERLLRLVPRFPQWGYNTVVVSLLAATTVTLSSALVAFGFSYFRFPGRNLLFGILLGSMMLPGVVTMIPTFLIWDALGFYNTLTPLWAGNLFASAFYVFLLRQFFLGLPRELFEAARVDGASYLRMWWNVALPLTIPALIVVFVFELKAAWTDLFKPLIFLQDPALYTLSRGLKAVIDNPAIGGAKEWELLAAAGVITTVPMIIVFFLGQRYFIEGIATTGSKG